MNNRRRLRAALIALLAFSSVQVEQAWASICPRETASAAAPGHAPMDHPGAGHDRMPGNPGGSGHDVPCPLQAVSASCSVVLSIAPVAARPAAGAEAEAPPAPSESQLPDQLIGTSLFRPPQA